MMKQERNLEAHKGCVLTDYAFSTISNQMVLVFGDTFTALTIEFGYDSDVSFEEKSWDRDDFGDDELIRVGILTEIEVKEWRAYKDARYKANREANDLREFERLKKKYEP